MAWQLTAKRECRGYKYDNVVVEVSSLHHRALHHPSGCSLISFTSPNVARAFGKASPDPTATIFKRSGCKCFLAAARTSSLVSFTTLARSCWRKSFGKPSYSNSTNRLTIAEGLEKENTNEFTYASLASASSASVTWWVAQKYAWSCASVAS